MFNQYFVTSFYRSLRYQLLFWVHLPVQRTPPVTKTEKKPDIQLSIITIIYYFIVITSVKAR